MKIKKILLLVLLACVLNVNAAEKGKIEYTRPRYLEKEHADWKTKGRIVGISKSPQPFKISILNAKKKHIKAADIETQKDGKIIYEVWLKPGKYIMIIRAKGYEPLDLKDLLVKKGHDLIIDLKFMKTVN